MKKTSDALPNALAELLEAGQATPTQLQQQLADAGAPVHYEAIVAALRSLAGSGRAVQYTGHTWSLAESCTRPQDTPPAVPARERDVAKIECQRCGETKAPDEMLQRNGKPSRTCSDCFAKAHAKNAKPMKAAAKAAPPAVRSEADPALRVVSRVMVALIDADGAEHSFALTADQAAELREALA